MSSLSIFDPEAPPQMTCGTISTWYFIITAAMMAIVLGRFDSVIRV